MKNYMTKAKQKIPFYCGLFLFLLHGGCSNDLATDSQIERTMKLAYYGNLNQGVESLKINAYVFRDEKLVGPPKEIALDVNNNLSLQVSKNSNVYFLASNAESSPHTNLSFDASTESSLLSAVIGKGHLNDCFFTSRSVSDNGTVEMIRTVARLDLNLPDNNSIYIEKVDLNGLSAETAIFPQASVFNPTNRYNDSDTFSPATALSIEAFRYLYESSQPISLTVYGTIHGVKVTSEAILSQVERNKIYVLKVRGSGAAFDFDIERKEWETGSSNDSELNNSAKLQLNTTYSTLSSGVEMDVENNKVTVPTKGGSFTLAIVSNEAVDKAYVMGLSEGVTVGSFTQENVTGGVCTKIPVVIPPQEVGKPGYGLKIGLKKRSQSSKNDFVEIIVNAIKPEEVELGGLVWMQFNANSSDLTKQVFPVGDLTVREMYENKWLDCVGALYQFGRAYAYTPWLSPVHNAGSQNQNIPWIADSHSPCPDGYRVPTRSELQKILPDGQAIPGSHILENGDTLNITLHRSAVQPEPINKVPVVARYIAIKSKRSGKALYIPLAGRKGDKVTTTDPTFGGGIRLWPNEYRGSGWAFAITFWPGVNSESGTMATEARSEAESYSYVRCVKK